MTKKDISFEWDKNNTVKNWIKHNVRPFEAEEVFSDSSAIILHDYTHSGIESRYIIIGKTKKHRVLYIAFMVRNKRVRVISARDVNKKEKKIYEKEINRTKI